MRSSFHSGGFPVSGGIARLLGMMVNHAICLDSISILLMRRYFLFVFFLFSVSLSPFFLQFNISRMINSNQGIHSTSEIEDGGTI